MTDADLPRGFLALIGDLYDAALDEAKWQPLAPRIAACFDAESCMVQARDPDGAVRPLGVTENLTPALAKDYVDYYYQFDEWANRARLLPPNTAVLGEQVIPYVELVKTPFFDWLRKVENFYLVGAVIADAEAPLGIIGVHHKSRDFDEASRRLMQLLIPHLQRAFQLGRELARERVKGAVGLDGLDRLAVATLLVTGDGRVLFANRTAVELLRAGDGLRERNGRIVAATPRLAALIAVAAQAGAGRGGHAGGQVMLPRRDRLPLTALVSPLPAEGFGLLAASGLALLMVRDPVQAGVVDAAALAALFGLTPAEARLAAALADGGSVEDVAAARDLSVQTARTQLKHVMAKTGARRQGELVALLLRSSATLRPR